jgi:hypothetical protein
MSAYFKFFPKVTHTNRMAVDITRRSKVLEYILNDPYVYLPYTVDQDDRPEDIANFYYDTPEKVWLIYYANNIIDPYSQWPLTQSDFNRTLVKKYEKQSGQSGFDVLAWAKNTTINDNIVYYQNIDNPNIKINVLSYQSDPKIIGAEWKAIRVYEYETIINENKRNIFLIDKKFADKFEKDLETTINE